MNTLQAGFSRVNVTPMMGIPMQDSYDEGGYEARSSRYKAGTAELIIEEGKALLDTLHKEGIQ